MKKLINRIENMNEKTRETILRNIMRGIAIYSALCTLLAVVSIIIGICGIPIPWIDTIVLFAMVTYINIAISKYHKEVGLW
jgi:hypothetical protein